MKNEVLSFLIMMILGLFVIAYIRIFLIYHRVSDIEKTVTQIVEKMESAK